MVVVVGVVGGGGGGEVVNEVPTVIFVNYLRGMG